MQIRFYANLRTLVGETTLEISDPSVNTLLKLFEHLLELYPHIRPHLLDDQGNFRQDLPMFVNGRNPRLSAAGLDISLEADDVISLFSPIASGRMNVEVLRR